MSLCLVVGQAVAVTADEHDGPVVITDQDQCDGCVMMITRYPGPKGEVLFKDKKVGKFCSTRCMFCYASRNGNAQKIDKYFVHDMGATDWEHPDDRQFIDARRAWYVYGTNRKATMGPAVAPFSTKRAAQAHIATYGGKLYRFDDITPALIGCKKKK